MKTLYLTLFILIFCACKDNPNLQSKKNLNPGDIQSQLDIDSVKSIIKNSFQEILSDLDSTKINTYYTVDFLLLDNGNIWNHDSIKNYLKQERKEVAKQGYQRLNQFKFIKSKSNGNSIWIAYDNYGTWVKGNDTLGTAHWLESVVAIKDNDGWKLQQLHSTHISNE